jgi:hypothetical protein
MSKSHAIRGSIKTAYFLNPLVQNQAFAVKFVPWHAFTFTASQVLEKDLDPLHNHLLRSWENRKDPFWYSFICFKDAGKKNKVVKVALQRRVKEALVHSLEKYGYTRDGTWAKGTDIIPSINPYGGKDIYGTAQFMIDVGCLKTKFVDLQAQMDTTLEDMLSKIDQSERKQNQRAQYKKTPGGRNPKNSTSNTLRIRRT